MPNLRCLYLTINSACTKYFPVQGGTLAKIKKMRLLL